MIYFTNFILVFFLPGHSTVIQLLETCHSIVKTKDEEKFCCMVFCDLFKVFDTVWHKGLISKLQMYGICGDLLNWFENYLCNHKQRVMYKPMFSSYRTINAGVPQWFST